jgi:transposase InsO family protein
MRYVFIKAEKGNYPIRVLCRVMEVCRSAFYEWLKKSPPDITENVLVLKAARIHRDSGRSYGARRISVGLKNEGWMVGRYKARTLMRKAGIEARRKKRFRYTTDSDHLQPIAPNLVERRFDVAETNRVWCADITYLDTREGFMYLAVVIDLASRKVVGWALSKRITKELVIAAFRKAFLKRRPKPGLIFHSDRGSQYASEAFRRLLKTLNIRQSMSRKGDCWDNAVAERFFRSLKSELTNWTSYKTREQLTTDVFRYIELFYNTTRLHSYLGYTSPDVFEQALITN